MTSKEKAKELVNKLFEFNHRVKWDIDNDEWTHDYYQAKQCALISVDEILNLSKIASLRRDEVYMELEYWIEVKQEIEKL